MNAIMKLVVKTHTGLFRLTGGKFGGTMQGGKVLLLTTTGRKSGQARTVPLGYIEDEAGNPVVTASAAGSDAHPAWYENLKAKPEITYQVGDKTIQARAEIADPELRNRLWATLTAKHPGYLEYMKKTTRVIPMVILKPMH